MALSFKGIYNYGYRDYQPETARFTTVDPIRDGGNWFAYVNNDPVNWVDLWGLSASDKISVTAIGGGVGGGFSFGVGPVEVINGEIATVTFSIAETGKVFTADYYTLVEAREGISVSIGAYYVSSESHKTFPAETTSLEIARDYAGKNTSFTISIGPFSISGSEINGWSTYSVSVGPGWGINLSSVDKTTTKYIDGSLNEGR